MNLEDLPLEQYRTRDELPLVLQWPCARADDCVTLPADLETMDLLTTAISQLTLRAVEPWRLRNVFENFFDAGDHLQSRNRITHPHELGFVSC